jgi:UDP-galactopyranose mutase
MGSNGLPGFDQFRIVIVGSGFFGSVIAQCVANELDIPVLLLDRRTHFGGNSWSEIDPETSIEYHRYGSHLFHTSNARVWEYINRFSKFSNYRHRVFTYHQGRMYTIPINLMTINNFFGKTFTPGEAKLFIEEEISEAGISTPLNLEEKAISLIGRRLYEAFVRGYTQKQWETDPRELPANIISRLPVRFSCNDFYFSDHYEGLPLDGYGKVFERMLSSKNIHVELDCDFFDIRDRLSPEALVIYTGPIDRFYEYRHGMLGWRTLDFELERLPIADFQGAAQVNYADTDVGFTRIHEFKHLHPERPAVPNTLIMREYSRFANQADEPYYPIGRKEDTARYEKYREMSAKEERVIFGGRLGSYRYLDMHQAIAAALKCYSERVAPWLTQSAPLDAGEVMAGR